MTHFQKLAPILAAALLLISCAPEPPLARDSKDATQLRPILDLDRYKQTPIGRPAGHQPWVAHLNEVDLDNDGLLDLIVCEAKDDTVSWLRQTAPGKFEEKLLADDMRAPVRSEPVDLDKDGDLDILVSSMSIIFPNNDRIGALYVLENDGSQIFRKRIILEKVDRVSDARAADFDNDGRLDIAIGQFGYDQGQVQWLRQTAPWKFAATSLLRLSGCINVCVADYNSDGSPDIAAQISQQWEEIHLFENDGQGNFTGRVLWGSTNEDFANSGMRASDLDQDGDPDLLFANGDGFGPTPVPGPRPWHGVQWLKNDGKGNFSYHHIGHLAGAYAPLPNDMDGDGDLDVIALSAFNNWRDPQAESFVWYQNNGDESFTKHVLAHQPTHLLTVALGDFDGSGRDSLITGAFHAYPPYDKMTRLILWTPSP
ncbi:MAG: VCBS repeat-containing protein [Verrucomicrobiota bacterium]